AVLAHPPSAGYLLRKFVVRHRVPVLAAFFVGLALVTGMIVATWGLFHAKAAAAAEAQAKRTAQQREAEAHAGIEFVEAKVFAAARPEGQEGGLGRDVKLRDAIDAALPFLEHAFPDQPIIEARLRGTLGRSFSYLGDATKAAGQHERARDLFTRELSPDHP